MKNRIFTGVLAAIFLGVMFGGLFHMSMGMDMAGGSNTQGCPFMSHEEALCSMSVFEHFGEWKANFLAVIPTVSLLLGALVAAAIFLSAVPDLIFTKRRSLHVICVLNKSGEVLSFPRRSLQELFSSGVLHPKLF